MGRMLVEIDPEKMPAPAVQRRCRPSDDVRELVGCNRRELLRALIRALLRQDLAGGRSTPRAVELVGAINRLLEAAGIDLDQESIGGAMRPSPAPKPPRTIASAS